MDLFGEQRAVPSAANLARTDQAVASADSGLGLRRFQFQTNLWELQDSLAQMDQQAAPPWGPAEHSDFAVELDWVLPELAVREWAEPESKLGMLVLEDSRVELAILPPQAWVELGTSGALTAELVLAESVAWVGIQRAAQVVGQDSVFAPLGDLLVEQAARVSSVRSIVLRIVVLWFAAGWLVLLRDAARPDFAFSAGALLA